MDSLKPYYDARAALAYVIEEDARKRRPVDTKSVKHYDRMCSEIAHLELAWSPSPPALDWCSLCGSAEREQLPGASMCVSCTARTTQEERDA